MRQDFAKLYRSGYSGMPAEKLLSFLKLPLDKCSLHNLGVSGLFSVCTH